MDVVLVEMVVLMMFRLCLWMVIRSFWNRLWWLCGLLVVMNIFCLYIWIVILVFRNDCRYDFFFGGGNVVMVVMDVGLLEWFISVSLFDIKILGCCNVIVDVVLLLLWKLFFVVIIICCFVVIIFSFICNDWMYFMIFFIIVDLLVCKKML